MWVFYNVVTTSSESILHWEDIESFLTLYIIKKLKYFFFFNFFFIFSCLLKHILLLCGCCIKLYFFTLLLNLIWSIILALIMRITYTAHYSFFFLLTLGTLSIFLDLKPLLWSTMLRSIIVWMIIRISLRWSLSTSSSVFNRVIVTIV